MFSHERDGYKDCAKELNSAIYAFLKADYSRLFDIKDAGGSHEELVSQLPLAIYFIITIAT